MKQGLHGRSKIARAGFPTEYANSTARPDFALNTTIPRHRWYRFKEGFSAGLVRSFIMESFHQSKPCRILDPFLGSGTTAVEGAALGCRVDGIETNPFMEFLATVKVDDYTTVRNLEGIALACLKNHKRDDSFALPNNTTLVERKELSKWLLNRTVANRFVQIRTAISRIESAVDKNLVLLALMASIEEVANARKDGKCWRYKKNWGQLKYNAASLDEAFAKSVLSIAADVYSCPKLRGKATVRRGDARAMAKILDPRAVYDGVLTSPPYLNSFDYTDIYRPELLLMKTVNNAEELRKLRFSTLRSHVQVDWAPSVSLKIPLLQRKIKDLTHVDLWSRKIPQMVNAYFVDLDRVVAQLVPRIRKGSKVGFVVADSAYNGVVIPVDLILSEIFERHGLKTQKIVLFRETLGNGNHQKRSSQHLREVMVVAENTKKRYSTN